MPTRGATSEGHNILPYDVAVSALAATDLANVDAKIRPLQTNGGPTATCALAPDSPAVDGGDPQDAPASDQRGVARPQGIAPDIGAFELVWAGPPQVVLTSASNQTVIAGINLVLTARPFGALPLSFRWEKSGVGIAETTNAALFLPFVRTSDAGNYTLVVTNVEGAVTSAVVVLTVHHSLQTSATGGGTVEVAPRQASYPPGSVAILTATPGRWHAFTRWDDGETNNPRSVVLNTNLSFTAVFYPTTALETLTFNGVSRTAPAGTPAIFVDDRFVPEGSVTNLRSAQVRILTTLPNGLTRWTRDGSQPSPASLPLPNPLTLRGSARIRAVTYDADLSQAWECDPVELVILPAFFLNATTAGGGSVWGTWAGRLFPSNEWAVIQALPAAGWTFLQWLGDVTGSSPWTNVVMTRDKYVVAVFGTRLHTQVTGLGSVRVNPHPDSFPYGWVARLTAVPDPGGYFVRWSKGAGESVNPLSLVITSANPVVSAEFARLSGNIVTLTVLVDGWGQVAVDPSATTYTNGAPVTLTAWPDVEQAFLGWSGDVSGSNNPLVVTMDQRRVITASFTQRPRLSLPRWFGDLRQDGCPLLIGGELQELYVVEGATNLTSLSSPSSWSPLATVESPFGVVQWFDSQVTNAAQRFYRVRKWP
ncbi:MAG: hypothetical protein HZA90_05465 [Verrucomicrobia bacterium]|nr:hypothetical protein [Verrucomicrobiota bacterium]